MYVILALRGVFRAGHWAMVPPLGSQDSIISIEYYAKLRHASLPFVSWAEALITQRVCFNCFIRLF